MTNESFLTRRLAVGALSLALAGGAAACSSEARENTPAPVPRTAGTLYTVRDTLVMATFDATGVAAPLQQATLSTKLMGTVTQVLVKEGDVVGAGQLLVRIDARDLNAKGAQAAASLAEADAMHRDVVQFVQLLLARNPLLDDEHGDPHAKRVFPLVGGADNSDLRGHAGIMLESPSWRQLLDISASDFI